MLVGKILDFARELEPAERDNLKLILGEAAAGFAPDGRLPTSNSQSMLFRSVIACLSQIQPHAMRVPLDGLAFRGKLPVLQSETLRALTDESAQRRKQAIREGGYLLGCGGELANRFAVSDELTAFVTSHAGPVSPTGVASYLYYEEPGQGLDPHVDTDVFSVNLILMLRHQFPTEGEPSHLVIFPPEKDSKRINLVPGDAALLFADCIVHAREPMKPGEVVHLLTIGFRPIA